MELKDLKDVLPIIEKYLSDDREDELSETINDLNGILVFMQNLNMDKAKNDFESN